MKNNWYVLTGAPSSGKTTMLELLKNKGSNVVCEMARLYIDQEIDSGKTIEQIRNDEVAFQEKVLKLKIETEKNIDTEEVTFFDRGIPDSDAYYALCGVNGGDLMEESMKNSQYKKVFLLDPLDYEKDYARIETREDQIKIHDLLKKSYEKINADIITVPIMSIPERLDFILNNM